MGDIIDRNGEFESGFIHLFLVQEYSKIACFGVVYKKSHWILQWLVARPNYWLINQVLIFFIQKVG
jgi:hypothetical protein